MNIEDKTDKMAARHLKNIIMNKKLGFPQKITKRRTVSTAIAIVIGLKDITFEDVSQYSLIITEDERIKTMARMFDKQIELASINPEKFVSGIDSFFNKLAAFVKKNDLYRDFLELYRIYRERSYTCRYRDYEVKFDIYVAYINLMMEAMGHLRKNKFALKSHICGISTSGELLECIDPYWNVDFPEVEIETKIFSDEKNATMKSADYYTQQLVSYMRKIGYPDVKSYEDVETVRQRTRLWTNTVYNLVPFINEYTYDMLPEVPYTNLGSISIKSLSVLSLNPKTFEKLQEWNATKTYGENMFNDILSVRNRTLPTNGVKIVLSGFRGDEANTQIIYMKEVLHADTIMMLYRIQTNYGDICGTYDTKTGKYTSTLEEIDLSKTNFDVKGVECESLIFEFLNAIGLSEKNVYPGLKHKKLALLIAMEMGIKELILFYYACVVAKDFPFDIENSGNAFGEAYYNERTQIQYCSLKAHIFLKGGKLTNTYVKERLENRDAEKYTAEEKSIQGYIRKLPVGQTASDEAVRYARQLGYELSPGETYVRPFVKNVLRLKKRID